MSPEMALKHPPFRKWLACMTRVKSKFTVAIKSRTFRTLSATLLVLVALPDILILSKSVVDSEVDEGCKKMFPWRLVLSSFESESLELSY